MLGASVLCLRGKLAAGRPTGWPARGAQLCARSAACGWRRDSVAWGRLRAEKILGVRWLPPQARPAGPEL
eukprot:7313730-Heterocapsa_arctica.AAC.1